MGLRRRREQWLRRHQGQLCARESLGVRPLRRVRREPGDRDVGALLPPTRPPRRLLRRLICGRGRQSRRARSAGDRWRQWPARLPASLPERRAAHDAHPGSARLYRLVPAAPVPRRRSRVLRHRPRLEGRKSEHDQRRLAARRRFRIAAAERAHFEGQRAARRFRVSAGPRPDHRQGTVRGQNQSGVLGMQPIILAVLLALARPAMAQNESGITLYGGYRFGGEFTDVATDQPWEFTDGSSFGLALAKGIDPNRQYEFFVSHRNGALKPPGFSAVSSNIGLAVTYYHLGGN